MPTGPILSSNMHIRCSCDAYQSIAHDSSVKASIRNQDCLEGSGVNEATDGEGDGDRAEVTVSKSGKLVYSVYVSHKVSNVNSDMLPVLKRPRTLIDHAAPSMKRRFPLGFFPLVPLHRTGRQTAAAARHLDAVGGF